MTLLTFLCGMLFGAYLNYRANKLKVGFYTSSLQREISRAHNFNMEAKTALNRMGL